MVVKVFSARKENFFIGADLNKKRDLFFFSQILASYSYNLELKFCGFGLFIDIFNFENNIFGLKGIKLDFLHSWHLEKFEFLVVF